jgi:hypothetical protein
MSEENSGDNGQNELPSEATFPKLEPGSEYPIMEPGDRLRAENLQLKLMNMALQEKELRAKLESVQRATGGLQQQYLALQSELGKKYGVDLITSQVRASDGAIVPRPQPPQPDTPSPKS